VSKVALKKVSREQKGAKREQGGAEGKYGGAEGEHIDEIGFSEGAKRRPFSQPAVTCYIRFGEFIYILYIPRT